MIIHSFSIYFSILLREGKKEGLPINIYKSDKEEEVVIQMTGRQSDPVIVIEDNTRQAVLSIFQQ